MDEDRRIRFLIAPVLFVASLLLGVWADRDTFDPIRDALKQCDLSKSIGLIGLAIAVGGVVVLAAGYIFGTLAYLFLRLTFFSLSVGKYRFHEVGLSENAPSDKATFERIWERLGAPKPPDPNQTLFAGAAFDHGILSEEYDGVHRWLVRRWSAFNIVVNSFWGLLFSIPFGLYVIKYSWTCVWFLSVVVFAVFLLYAEYVSWHDTMNMFKFMTTLPSRDKRRSYVEAASRPDSLPHSI
jgi:hypothetical protein